MSTSGAADRTWSPMSRRLLLALPLPKVASNELANNCSSIISGTNNLRPVGASNYHITVHFFGNLQSNQLDQVRALSQYNIGVTGLPLFCRLGGIAQMPKNDRARLLYAELKEGWSAVISFIKKVYKVVAAAGFPVQFPHLLPHITVARVRRGVNFISSLITPWSSSPFLLDRLVLYESFLSRAGVRYEPSDCQKRTSL